MYCKKCGKQIDDDALFCSYCGTKMTQTEELQRQQSHEAWKAQMSQRLSQKQSTTTSTRSATPEKVSTPNRSSATPEAERTVATTSPVSKTEKKKKSIFNRWWFWVIIIAVLFVSCMGSGGSEDAYTAQPDISETEYKALCQEILYENLARNPESYKGEYFRFSGEVVQVIEGVGGVNLRVNVTPIMFGNTVSYYDDTIYVVLPLKEGADRILEEDIITIYGICAGLYSYESIFGETISIPRIDAMYYELTN